MIFAGIDIPKCNLVIRYDFPNSYQSYVQCKSRARAIEALHVLLVPEDKAKDHIWQLAQYHCVEKVCFSLKYHFFNSLMFVIKFFYLIVFFQIFI